MKGICLCSGGLDSTLALLKLLKDGNEVVPMFVDYNQWSLEGERKAANEVVEWFWATPEHQYGKEYDFKSSFRVGTRHQVLHPGVNIRIIWGEEGVGSVWGRSIALAGLAAMWAYTHGDNYDFIALGNHEGDVGPDCKPGLFDTELGFALGYGTKSRISLLLPIREFTVEGIGKRLAEFGIPWNLMYSCYWDPPCGYKSPNEDYRCPGCRRKVIAMRAGGATLGELHLPNCKEISYQSELAEKVDY